MRGETTRRPLAWFGLTFLSAQIFAVALPPVALSLPAAFWAVAFFCRRRGRGSGLALLLATAVLFSFLCHWAYVALRVGPVLAYAGQNVTLTACVEESEPSYIDGMTRCRLQVLTLDGKPVHFRAQADRMPDSREGELIRGQFTLEPLEEDAYKLARYGDGVYLSAEYTEGILWEGESRSPGALFARLQRSLGAQLRRAVGGSEGAVLAAVCVGDKSHLTKPVREFFRKAGISHLLVVSGLHLTLLCGLLPGGRSRAGGAHRRRGALVSMGLTLLVMALVGFTPSVCRAGLVLLILCLGDLLLLPADPLTSLGAVALVLGLSNGFVACDVGLQLSFCATLGVLAATALAQRIERRAREKEEEPGLAARLGCGLLRLMLPPVLAALATLPVQLVQGFGVSGVTVPANLLVVWAIQPMLLAGVACALLGLVPFMAFAQSLLALPAGALAGYMLWVARALSALPFAQLALPRRYGLWVLALLALAFLWAKVRGRLRALPLLWGGVL